MRFEDNGGLIMITIPWLYEIDRRYVLKRENLKIITNICNQQTIEYAKNIQMYYFSKSCSIDIPIPNNEPMIVHFDDLTVHGLSVPDWDSFLASGAGVTLEGMVVAFKYKHESGKWYLNGFHIIPLMNARKIEYVDDMFLSSTNIMRMGETS